jgi:hypothetical protein
MPVDISHFTMIGFAVSLKDEAALSRTAMQYLQSCRPTNLTPSDIVCVTKDASGAELRISLRKDASGRAEFITMNPAFSGQGETKLDIQADVSDPDYKPFETTVSARFAGEQTPIVLDVADPEQAGAFAPGKTATVDIAGFSFNVAFFADEKAFYKAQEEQGVKAVLAANYFIPSGLFFEHVGGAMPDDAKHPVAYADLAGTIVQCATKTNSSGPGSFWWALIKSYDGMTLDVVLDPAELHEDPKPGEIITGRFWLSARLAGSP